MSWFNFGTFHTKFWKKSRHSPGFSTLVMNSTSKNLATIVKHTTEAFWLLDLIRTSQKYNQKAVLICIFSLFLLFSDIFWYLLISFDIFWYFLISFDIFWYFLISFDIFWYFLIFLIFFDIFWYLLIFFWYFLISCVVLFLSFCYLLLSLVIFGFLLLFYVFSWYYIILVHVIKCQGIFLIKIPSETAKNWLRTTVKN